MGSAVALDFLLGCCNLAASSVVVITGPFLLERSGCGGSGTVWLRGAGADCIGPCTFGGGVSVFVFLRNPPVDNAASLRGDRDSIRDSESEIALRAGDAALGRESSAATAVATLEDMLRDAGTSCTVSCFSLTSATTGSRGDADRDFLDGGTAALCR